MQPVGCCGRDGVHQTGSSVHRRAGLHSSFAMDDLRSCAIGRPSWSGTSGALIRRCCGLVQDFPSGRNRTCSQLPLIFVNIRSTLMHKMKFQLHPDKHASVFEHPHQTLHHLCGAAGMAVRPGFFMGLRLPAPRASNAWTCSVERWRAGCAACSGLTSACRHRCRSRRER